MMFVEAWEKGVLLISANHPIFYLTFHGDLEPVQDLLKANPELVKVRDAKNLTPLHVAASRGQDNINN